MPPLARALRAIAPLRRSILPHDLADRIKLLIQRDGYATGDRLPSMVTLARDFGVGAPTVRKALKRLEMAGTVTIRHGSGVYVGQDDDSFVMSNPVFSGVPTKRVLLDIQNQRSVDHRQHVVILDALRSRDADTARTQMREHLDKVCADLERWDPDTHPIRS